MYWPLKMCFKINQSDLALIKIIRKPLFQKVTMKMTILTWFNPSVYVPGWSSLALRIRICLKMKLMQAMKPPMRVEDQVDLNFRSSMMLHICSISPLMSEDLRPLSYYVSLDDYTKFVKGCS